LRKSREVQPGSTRRRRRWWWWWWLFFLAVAKSDEVEGSLRRREEEEDKGQMSARQSVRVKKTASATQTKGSNAAQSRSPTVSELPDLCADKNQSIKWMQKKGENRIQTTETPTHHVPGGEAEAKARIHGDPAHHPCSLLFV
jgi:hypothetical protein